MLVMICTSSILCFMERNCEANYKKDRKKVSYLFNKATRVTYFFCGIMACTLCPLIPDILVSSLGKSYSAGQSCICLMIFYPVFQATIQLQSTFLYAILDIKKYVKIICITSLIGFPISLFLVSDIKFFVDSLQLGSLGLSIGLLLFGILHQRFFQCIFIENII